MYSEGDVDLLHTLLEAQGHREVVRMDGGTPPDIRTFVIDLGRLVGAHPTRRQPPRGARKVWQGSGRLNRAIQVRDALGENSWNESPYTSVNRCKVPGGAWRRKLKPQPPRQDRAVGAEGAGEPVKRLRIEMAETDLHGPPYRPSGSPIQV